MSRSTPGTAAGKLLAPSEAKNVEHSGPPLPISEEELNSAFDFFDIEGQGKITPADLKARLGAFYKNLPPKEIKLLLGDGPFTKETLLHLLANNDLGRCRRTAEVATETRLVAPIARDGTRTSLAAAARGDTSPRATPPCPLLPRAARSSSRQPTVD